MPYVDGFVLAVPKEKLEEYKAAAALAGQVWMDHGALSYMECLADDVSVGEHTSFPRAVMAKDDEVVVFAWATYPSRAARDETMQKVFSDPRMKPQMENLPFDGKRMIYGGFQSVIEF